MSKWDEDFTIQKLNDAFRLVILDARILGQGAERLKQCQKDFCRLLFTYKSLKELRRNLNLQKVVRIKDLIKLNKDIINTRHERTQRQYSNDKPSMPSHVHSVLSNKLTQNKTCRIKTLSYAQYHHIFTEIQRRRSIKDAYKVAEYNYRDAVTTLEDTRIKYNSLESNSTLHSRAEIMNLISNERKKYAEQWRLREHPERNKTETETETKDGQD